ncbi:MAG: hypothetical protein KME50_12565 [Nostoc desertorum CM1-VF14]|jgi:hypothetical protein|nr:hypothetical protein [Nostoc desertorum CM1-VF14]
MIPAFDLMKIELAIAGSKSAIAPTHLPRFIRQSDRDLSSLSGRHHYVNK